MTDAAWMGRALGLASRAVGTTAPNPPVGAVLVRDGQVLGEGYTQPPGAAHAEVQALADCRTRGHDPRGATLYVTLEPCRHHGRTPPCTDAILAAGVGRVVVGTLDPYPPMRGASVGQLRAAGVEVELGVEQEACRRRVLGFARAVSAGLPEVTAKAGMSLDGRVATESGESQWITSPEARAVGHRLRAEHDAVLVGIGTVLADDPALTTRLVPGRDAVPVVLDTTLRTPAAARLLAGSRRAVIVTAEDAPERDLPAEIVRVPRAATGRVELLAALRALCARGLHRILVEGGPEVLRSLLDRGMVDTLELFVAPKLIPGGRALVGGSPIATLAEHVPLRFAGVEAVGADLHVTAELRFAAAADPFTWG